jgi:hypothetical protein
MSLQRVGVSLFTLIAIVSILLAGATIWLFVTNPVTVATAVNEGEISPLVRSLAEVLLSAFGAARHSGNRGNRQRRTIFGPSVVADHLYVYVFVASAR